jgi:hypothetical protein
MRVPAIVLVSIWSFATASVAAAQSVDDIINRLPAIAQMGVAKFVESEWSRLPQAELACVSQKLRQRGDSVEGVSRRAIFPYDPRMADIRNQCRASAAQAQREEPATPPQVQSQSDLSASDPNGLIASLRAELASSAAQIAQLQRTRVDAERAMREVEQARLAAENAKRDMEQAATRERAQFASMFAQLQSDSAEATVKLRAWQISTFAAAGGMVVLVAIIAVAFPRQRKEKPPTDGSLRPEPKLLSPPARAQASGGGESGVASLPQTSAPETKLQPELEEPVENVNGREAAIASKVEPTETT